MLEGTALIRTGSISPIIALMLLTSTGLSQTVRNRTSSGHKQQPIAVKRFDVNVESLPPRFAGQNPEMIYELVKAKLSNPAKSKFETELEYRRRSEEFARQAISGTVKAGDLFAFSLSGSALVESASADLETVSRNVETAYDAESQTFKVTLPFFLSDPDDYEWLSLWRRSLSFLSEYVGSNAFGAKRRVTRWGRNDVVLVVHGYRGKRLLRERSLDTQSDTLDWLHPDCEGDGMSLSCPIQIDGQTARALSRNLRAIIIGRLTAPFVSSESYTLDATIDSPAELRCRTKYLHLRLEQLWLVDASTGRVLRKYSRSKHDTDYPLKVEFRTTSKYVTIHYSIDGQSERFGDAHGLRIEAKQFVDIKMPYAEVKNIEVFVNGRPYQLQCREVKQFVYNQTDCGRIELPNAQETP
jgi:hypothetical protein